MSKGSQVSMSATLCRVPWAVSLVVFLVALNTQQGQGMEEGSFPGFKGKTDVGAVHYKGGLVAQPDKEQITVTGSGENIWGKQDAFFFAWKNVEGDISCRTDISWRGKGRHPHRKAGWMIRAGLDANDPYVDAVIHGDGLISMQYRAVKGGETAEVKSAIAGPATLLFERSSDQFTLYVLGPEDKLHPAGTISIPLGKMVYAGLVVCSHDSTLSETAVFSNVSMYEKGPVVDTARVIESSLETYDIETGIRTVVRRAREHFEAPNWSRDGRTLLYNSGGRLYSIPTGGGPPEEIFTGTATRCNNDHGYSWDGSTLAVSHHGDDGLSRIYLLPVQGGEPRRITEHGPSYWHGWSPDDKTLAYCAERNGEFDVYTIPVGGGEEKRLTDSPGLDDGPEYSVDGKTIYFNSVRTGQMKIWKMDSDGSRQEQVTSDDDWGDWFPHPSPDGKLVVLLSYDKSIEGHPPNMDVALRLMATGGGDVKTLTRLFGGQGTLNVPSWAPDSRRFAFVSYRLVAR